ncbi:MAG: alpha/beta hydrolase [Desulforegulaceae bacterium]|nr:alpha/beta hydrolase [Desulforegulaceae bacterium]
MTVINQEKIRIFSVDGNLLSLTIHSPVEKKANTLFLINSAMAVPQQYYFNFAEFICELGYAAVTYDYTGVGESLTQDLKKTQVKASDWALKDMYCVIEWVSKELFPERLFVIGHSYGGQTPGLLPNSDKIDAMATFSSQSGYWLLQGGFQKAVVALHMFLSFPLVSRAVGFMPMSKLGAGEDIPKNVALEWATWCRKPGYILDAKDLPVERYENFKAPVLAFSFDDDNWGTEKSVNTMMSAYPNLTRRHVIPENIGVSKIGHFGFFQTKCKKLWFEVIDWFNNTIPLQKN